MIAQEKRMHYLNRATSLPDRNTENGSLPHARAKKPIPDSLNVNANKWQIYTRNITLMRMNYYE